MLTILKFNFSIVKPHELHISVAIGDVLNFLLIISMSLVQEITDHHLLNLLEKDVDTDSIVKAAFDRQAGILRS
jgi:hypothetical protein